MTTTDQGSHGGLRRQSSPENILRKIELGEELEALFKTDQLAYAKKRAELKLNDNACVEMRNVARWFGRGGPYEKSIKAAQNLPWTTLSALSLSTKSKEYRQKITDLVLFAHQVKSEGKIVPEYGISIPSGEIYRLIQDEDKHQREISILHAYYKFQCNLSTSMYERKLANKYEEEGTPLLNDLFGLGKKISHTEAQPVAVVEAPGQTEVESIRQFIAAAEKMYQSAGMLEDFYKLLKGQGEMRLVLGQQEIIDGLRAYITKLEASGATDQSEKINKLQSQVEELTTMLNRAKEENAELQKIIDDTNEAAILMQEQLSRRIRQETAQ